MVRHETAHKEQIMTPAQKLAKIKAIYETVSITKDGMRVTSHAGYNLDGVIHDIGATGECDKTSLATLRRVRNQLSQIGRILGV